MGTFDQYETQHKMLFGAKFVVIDLANLISRAAFVRTQKLTTTDGRESGHVYRTYRSILKLKRDFGTKLIFAYEGAHDQNPRFAQFTGYKGTRTHTEEKDQQRAEALAMLKLMQATWITHPEAEADDAIATWCKQHQQDNLIVVSSDHDLWYLLRYPKVTLLDKKEQITRDRVVDKYGCHPVNVPLIKALYGDASDNIPKVPRLKWADLEAFFLSKEQLTLPDFFAWVEANCSKSTRDKVAEYKNQIEQMFRVTQLREDLELPVVEVPGDKAALRAYLELFECKSVLNTVQELT